MPSSAPWAFYDPDSSSWRTSQQSLDDALGLTSSSLDLPASGSMRSGRVYERPTSGRLTVGSAGSALPTPRVSSARSSRKSMVENRQWSAPSLEQAVEIASGVLPREFETWDEVPGRSGKMLPTPNASVAQDGETPETWLARREKIKAKGINGNGMGTPLTIAVQPLPTPRARDWKGNDPNPRGGVDLNEAVSRQRGATTPPPSNAGKPSSDDQPRLPLTDADD